MSDTTFYDLWVAALRDLALAKEDAEMWRVKAESREREAALLRLLLKDLKKRQTTPQL